MSLLKSLLLTVALAMAVWASEITPVTQTSQSTGNDLVLGTWKLNLAHSKYSPGPAPKSQTRIYEADPNGIRATITTVDANGHSNTIQYTAKYDGVDYPITGSPEWDAIALKKVNAYVAEAVLAHAGKEFGKARRVISPDGKTMTITFDAQMEGRPAVHNVTVFDRQEK